LKWFEIEENKKKKKIKKKIKKKKIIVHQKIINVYCKNIMNLMIERKAIKNTLYLFSMVLPDNENEETIKPKYTAELPIITSKFCGVRVLYYQNH